MSDLAAIILASGRGTRYGAPKAEASLENGTFLDRILATLQAAGILSTLAALGLETPDMLSTLRQVAGHFTPDRHSGILIWPVDHPLVKPETVVALGEAFSAHPEAVLRPTYKGERGHPIILPAGFDLSGDDAGRGLAGIIRTNACTVIDLPVDDPGILRNINRPEDLEDTRN